MIFERPLADAVTCRMNGSLPLCAECLELPHLAVGSLSSNGATQLAAMSGTDLRLDPNKEYLVYEFWTKKFLGSFKGTFTSQAVEPYDCDIYSIVEKQDRPVLVSTSRHVRQMAFDIKNMAYDAAGKSLSGVSRAVAGDPYQLRIYVPDGFAAKRVELSEGITATMKTEGNALAVEFTSSTGKDVEWKVFF